MSRKPRVPSAQAPQPTTVNRRTFLAGGLATGSLLVTGGLSAGSRRTQALTNDCGVASGEPRPDSVVLWTRIPDEYLPSSGSLAVTWEVASSDTFSSIVRSGTFDTSADVDWTVTVLADGLLPYTRYFYRFRTAAGFVSVVGRTLTAPADDADNTAVRFAFVSCQNYPAGYYNAHTALAQDDVDFVVSLGDNIYEGSERGVRQDPIDAVSLSDYRAKYKLYLSDPNLQEVRRLFPFFVIWDDHEVFNNFNGTDATADDRERQRAGYQAFREYMPIDPSIFLTDENGIPVMKTYRRASYGRLADLFLLDERQYRDEVVCGRDAASFGCDELYAEDRSMLGVEQAEWLKGELLASGARWKFLLNEVMMMAFKLTNSVMPFYSGLLKPEQLSQKETYEGFIINLDQWDGYPEERRQLLTLIEENGIDNVVVLTGDIHNCYAGLLRPDFTKPASPAVAVELVGGSITSDGIGEYTGGRDLSDTVLRLLKPANPHMEYIDAYHHVYTRVEVSPEETVATYVGVDTIKDQSFQFFELARLTVPDGSPELIIENPARQTRRRARSRQKR